MNQLSVVNDRLKNMLINDKKDNPNKIVGLLKSEIFYVLKNYMDIDQDDIYFDIGIDNDGSYQLSFNAEVKRIYIANYLL